MQVPCVVLHLGSEALLDNLDFRRRDPESLRQHRFFDGGLRPKQGTGNELHAGVLWVQYNYGNGGFLADTELEMHQTFGEDEHVSGANHRVVDLVVGVNEPGVEFTVDYVQKFAGSWVRVGRNYRADGNVHTRNPKTQGVEPRVAHSW